VHRHGKRTRQLAQRPALDGGAWKWGGASMMRFIHGQTSTKRRLRDQQPWVSESTRRTGGKGDVRYTAPSHAKRTTSPWTVEGQGIDVLISITGLTVFQTISLNLLTATHSPVVYMRHDRQLHARDISIDLQAFAIFCDVREPEYSTNGGDTTHLPRLPILGEWEPRGMG
jgi:hypothetical protein